MATETTTAPRVRTPLGTLVGTRSAGVHRFLGVPFASVGPGAGRFAAARPAAAWSGDRPALTAGPSAAQPGSVRARLVLGEVPPAGDDCLVLNVWTPDPGARLPVLCWVHGGGFTNGSGAATALDGTALARAGVVVVTMNYRLGVLGFAHHPELTGDAGNRGLADVAAAVRWVQRTIGTFGGDPARITLGGDSAGAMSAGLLAASDPDLPITRLALYGGVPSVALVPDAAEKVDRLAAALGVRVAELAELPSSVLVTAADALGPAARFAPSATDALRRGLDEARDAIPTMITTAADEGTFFLVDDRSPRTLDEREAVAALEALGGDGAQRYRTARAAAPPSLRDHPHRIVGRALARARFDAPADAWSARRAARAPIWRARHERPATLWDGWLGATHTLDVPLTFGTHRAPPLARLYAGDARADAVAAELRDQLVRFVSGSAPHHDWPTWTPDRRHVRVTTTAGHDIPGRTA